MRKHPQHRRPYPRIEYRENSTHGRRLKKAPPRRHQTPVSTGSDSFASVLSEEDEVDDVNVLEEIERGYYEHLERQQQNQLLLEAAEEDDLSQSQCDMPYLISGSVSRDSAANSELRQHSRRPDSKARHRTGGSSYKQRRRKTRLSEEPLHPDEYLHHMSDEYPPAILPDIEDIHEHSTESASNSDAMNPNRHHQQTKTHRRKSTKDAGARHGTYWTRTRNTTKKRDGNHPREPSPPRRDPSSSSHSSGPQATRYAILQERLRSLLMRRILYH